MSRALPRLIAALVLALIGLRALPADAGCGCAKPPPPPAPVRPNVTYGGMPVTFFSPLLAPGQSYTATFTAMNGTTATANGVATLRRDQADAVWKAQVSVTLPAALPLGPASITLAATGAGAPLLSIADASFTVAAPPIALPLQYGTWDYPNSQAAVGRDGTVYMSLDLTGMKQPLVFEAQMLGYPLRFDANGVVFKNVQGFLMQMLMQSSPTGVAPIPGMFVNPSATPATASDQLHYSRHEFDTYFLQHAERQPHAVDPTDPNWHIDGSPHIDHDHLIVAIVGTQNDGTLPAPGATPLFTLRLNAYSLFYKGLVGDASISMGTNALTRSFDPTTGGLGSNGDVFTNGTLTVSTGSLVQGDATAASFTNAGGVTGTMTVLDKPTNFMAVKVPAGLPSLGAINVKATTQTIVGPGSFQVDSISIGCGSGTANLFIDNSAGPVTLYVLGGITIKNGTTIQVADPDPEKFAIYVAGTSTVSVTGSPNAFYGVIYAPTSSVIIKGAGGFWGAFMGKSVSVTGGSIVSYDNSLKGH